MLPGQKVLSIVWIALTKNSLNSETCPHYSHYMPKLLTDFFFTIEGFISPSVTTSFPLLIETLLHFPGFVFILHSTRLTANGYMNQVLSVSCNSYKLRFH